MFISVLDLFKVGIGPSSSHTMGPMRAAHDFLSRIDEISSSFSRQSVYSVRCILKGSLAYTGKGHATDRAVTLGLHNYLPEELAKEDVNALVTRLELEDTLVLKNGVKLKFKPDEDIVFDKGEPLPQHPNGMIFTVVDENKKIWLTETYFSIGGGFINTLAEIDQLNAPLKMETAASCPYPFDSARSMLRMSRESTLSIAEMKKANELQKITADELNQGLDKIWSAMQQCVENGLKAEGRLPGGLKVERRAKKLYNQLNQDPIKATLNDWLCAYAMAVNEENAAGHLVVT
ncbi:MAG TPA: serine dehydratase beta chain, partial [Nitrosomonas sp.]|nr:serine dehydratase beta chain [Nitrosomonas sp.]